MLYSRFVIYSSSHFNYVINVYLEMVVFQLNLVVYVQV